MLFVLKKKKKKKENKNVLKTWLGGRYFSFIFMVVVYICGVWDNSLKQLSTVTQ